MKKIFATLAALATLTIVLAQDLSTSTEFALIGTVDGARAVVGAGEWDAGELELDLLDGYTGLVTLVGVDEEGNTVNLEGEVVFGQLFVGAEYQDVVRLVSEAGGSVEISYMSEIDVDVSDFQADAEDELEEGDDAEEEEEDDVEEESEAEDEDDDEAEEDDDADEAEEDEDDDADEVEEDEDRDDEDEDGDEEGSDGESEEDDDEDEDDEDDEDSDD